MGGPKSLVHDADGTSWLARSVAVLEDGGCDGVTVVLGAESDRGARLLADHGFTGEVVVADDWDEGMGASLRAGLRHLRSTPATVTLVNLVDLPDVSADVVARLVARLGGPSDDHTDDHTDDHAANSAGDHAHGGLPPAAVLERAAYEGVPGHPVVLGRDHWAGVIREAAGDRGARDYLLGREVVLVECGDLAGGADVDSRPAGATRETVPADPVPREV